jgi:hypothetical protein
VRLELGGIRLEHQVAHLDRLVEPRRPHAEGMHQLDVVLFRDDPQGLVHLREARDAERPDADQQREHHAEGECQPGSNLDISEHVRFSNLKTMPSIP